MAKVDSKVNYTAQDYMSLPLSETERYELIDRDLISLPRNKVLYQHVVGNLLCSRGRSPARVGERGELLSGPLDIVLSNENVLQPFLLYISWERQGIITDANIQGAPDLVIKVLSPITAERPWAQEEYLCALRCDEVLDRRPRHQGDRMYT